MSQAVDLGRVAQMRAMQQQQATERLVGLAAEIYKENVTPVIHTDEGKKNVARESLKAAWIFWEEVGPFLKEMADEHRTKSSVPG